MRLMQGQAAQEGGGAVATSVLFTQRGDEGGLRSCRLRASRSAGIPYIGDADLDTARGAAGHRKNRQARMRALGTV